MYGEPTWKYRLGDVVVYDIEHLFGRDLVLARWTDSGYSLPLAIHSHSKALDWFQMRWATKWAIATANEDWETAAAMMRVLGEDLT